MLEALIRTKNSPCSDKRAGDVICVKLKELAEWGAMEKRVHDVVDWQDDELESSMRETFAKTGIGPIKVTPYKECENCIIFNDGGETRIFEGEVTKTRSKKYFDFILQAQQEKSQEQILQEFEANKEFTKNEVLKEKPGVPIKIEEVQTYEKKQQEKYVGYLETLKGQLSKHGVKTEIIDGKLVRV